MKKVLFAVMAVAFTIAISGFRQVAFAHEETKYPEGYETALLKLEQSDLSYEVMDGVNNKGQYVLFTGKETGYMIYDTVMDIYIEYSKEDKSPYADTSNSRKKVYAGPTYYLEKSEERYFDALDKRELNKFEIEEFSRYNEDLNASVFSRKESKKNERFLTDWLTKSKKETSQIDPSLEADSLYAHETTTTTSTAHAIPYSYYYENLRYAMGVNVEGTCSFVAAGMVMSYYDSVYNDNIVPEAYDVDGKLRESETSNASPIKPFETWGSIIPTAFNQSPGVSNDFEWETIEYMDTGNSMNIGETGRLISHYLNEAGVSYTKKEWNIWEGISKTRDEWVRDGIDSGNPVYIHFSGLDESLDDRELNHAVVGYEYDDTGIFVNFGWRGVYTHTNINNYTLQNVLYFLIHETETTIYNYEWTSTNGADGTMSISGDKICNHNIETKSVDDTYHVTRCFFCGAQNIYTGHTYVNGVCTVCGRVHENHVEGDTWYGTPESHYRKCIICGANIYCPEPATLTSYTSTTHTYSCSHGYSQTSPHTFDSTKTCTACGYHSTHVHFYTSHYELFSSTHHKAYCSCGSFILQPHVLVNPLNPNAPAYCSLCGYQVDDGNIMYLMKKDKELEKFLV